MESKSTYNGCIGSLEGPPWNSKSCVLCPPSIFEIWNFERNSHGQRRSINRAKVLPQTLKNSRPKGSTNQYHLNNWRKRAQKTSFRKGNIRCCEKVGLKNLFASKDSFPSTGRSKIEKLAKSKLGMKHGLRNFLNKKLKGDPHFAYYETQITSKANPAIISIIEGKNLSVKELCLKLDSIYQQSYI